MLHVYATDFTETHVSHSSMFCHITLIPPGCPDVGDAYGERVGTRGEESRNTVVVTAGSAMVPSEFLGDLLSVMLI